MSKGTIVYWLFGGLLSGLYSAGEITGWEPRTAAYERIDPTVRQAAGGSGGARSFWYSGSHGGK